VNLLSGVCITNKCAAWICTGAKSLAVWSITLGENKQHGDARVPEETELHTPTKHRRVWKWISLTALLALTVLLIIGEVIVHRAGPILKDRVIETLRVRFNSRVELDGFDVSLLKGLEVSGKGLRIYAPDDMVAAGATDPLIQIGNFEFHTGLRDLFVKPMHVGAVHVSGLSIHIPPKEQRHAAAATPHKNGKIKILVDEILVENSELVIGTMKPDREPKRFALQRIRMRDVGPERPWQYDATLVNAIPRGDIHATGFFGPWNNEEPGGSMVNGDYTFDHAELNTIKGIGGTLSSVGKFDGQLDRIVADGTTKTPDFSLDTANHKMPLETTFHAIIDGTNGDTYLQPVHAKLGGSEFTCEGSVVNVKGKGHVTDLNINVPAGRLRDFLELAVKTHPPVMQSTVGMKVHLRVPYGKESVTKKLQMQGAFTLRSIHFTNPKVQDKVDMLSLRAQGNAKDAKPGAEDVNSEMRGSLVAGNGQLKFPKLQYLLPGAEVNLEGTYSMDGNTFDFFGKVRTQARVSQMVATPWKSFLLKAVDPFFSKHGAGTEVPIKITGTQSEPKFGLDFHHKKSEAEEQKEDLQNRKDELTPDGRLKHRPPPGLPATKY
jgi:hypothetical protein